MPNKKRKITDYFESSVPEDDRFNWIEAGDTLLHLEFKSSEKKVNVDFTKIAAFDLDGTLILTKSGNVFARGAHDWRFFTADVPQRLAELHDAGYRIVIFTNQAGLNTEKSKSIFQQKIKMIMKATNVPLDLIAAIKKDINRKPCIGMFDYITQRWKLHENQNLPLKKIILESFYVGDAAARPNDHSIADYGFAHNLGLKFMTPEEYFKRESVPHGIPAFRPHDLKSICERQSFKLPYDIDNPEMILMVGYPSSGKSSFVVRELVPFGFVRINQDELKSREACLRRAKTCLIEGKSVVIDNTNPDQTTRSLYIDLAKEMRAVVRCIKMETSEELAKHLNVFRQFITSVPRLPDVAYRTYKARYQDPGVEEGFEEIITVNFVPDFVGHGIPEHENLFYQFLY